MITDVHGEVMQVNNACERVLGWTSDQICGRPVLDFLHPDDIPAAVSSLENMLRGEQVNAFENRYRTRDGGYRWLSWRYRYDTEDALCYACAVDISQHKTYQLERESAIQRYDMAMTATSEGVWDFDLDTRELKVSDRYKEILGYSEGDTPRDADDWLALIDPADQANVSKSFDDHLAGLTATYSATFRMQHRSGAWKTILSRGVALRDTTGKAYRAVGIHRDITDQQNRENELHALKERAESANRAKSDFLANMSHEIRTPINAVIGAAHILGRGPLPEEKHLKVVSVLTQSASSLLDLINDLLDLSKIEAGALDLERTPFDARGIVSDVLKTLEIQASSKGLELQQQNRCNCITERLFVGDKGRIGQILLNLCANAVKFTETGTITVGIDCQPTTDPQIEELRFFISDTGVGIAPEKLDAIFGKFEQGDSRLNRRHGGTGLGLAIAKSLTHAMGGQITAQSEIGVGSTFSVRLPLERLGGPVEDDGVTDAPDLLTQGARVLIVEDNAANILVATHFLSEFGYDYEVAESGETALAKITEGCRYHLILMDIQMPGMDGRETTRHIRAFELQQNRERCPIIAMTAHALLTDKAQCFDAGMDDYIAKPFDPDVLKAKIAEAVKASRPSPLTPPSDSVVSEARP
ncbi:hypothetical protein AEYBE204_09375 [Asticcacaulis sp. YBE204]|nr:hypothetical protein AEYBE204_09375 [Asticcacaulis sp. YBE204]